MRLFIAIQLDGNIKDALTAVQKTLRVNRVGGNYTKIENLHLIPAGMTRGTPSASTATRC